MIRFLVTRGYSHTFKKVKATRDRPAVDVINFDNILRAQWLRPAAYVFTDLDRLSYWDLEKAGQLYVRLKEAGFPVLNHPAKVKKRYALLRALHAAGLNDFNVYRVDELPASMRFPVFLRKEQGHAGPLGGLMHTRDEVLAAVDRAVESGIPPEVLMVIEYAGEPVKEGQYRKMAAFRIGSEIVPHFSVNDNQWLVKDGRMDLSIEDLYLEEQQTLETNPYAEHLQKVFDVAQIDYGRADFAFYKGRLQIFEINTNPNVPSYSTHPSAVRLQNMRVAWEKYLKALYSIDCKTGKPVHFPLPAPDRVAMELEARRLKIRAAQRTRDTRLGVIEYSSRVKYSIGGTIDFSEAGTAALHTREGWGKTESWGTWTLGKKAVLKIYFNGAPVRDLYLNAVVRGLIHELQSVVRAEIHVNGTKVGNWEVRDEGLVKLRARIPAVLLRGKECKIVFTIPNPLSPKFLGLSDDPRPLGLGFRTVDLQWA